MSERSATPLRGPAFLIRMPLALALIVLAGLALALATVLRARAAQAAMLRADPETILGDKALRAAALDEGRTIFESHCASCHGAAAKGNQSFGVPDLTDDERLYGEGKVAEVEDIVRYGIRAYHKRGWNLAAMPAYATAAPYKGEPLPPQPPAQIEALTQYLLSFTGRAGNVATARRDQAVYEAAGCWDCHGHDAGGDAAIGAPALTDAVWLYGGSHDAIARSIAGGRAGLSPAFGRALTAAEIRAVAVYVASLAPAAPAMAAR